MQTNEFRVRPVQRFQLTHYQEGERDRSCRTVGEFPSVEAAEEVGVALQALVPGSTLVTLHGRQAEYPPKTLAAAMAASDAGSFLKNSHVQARNGDEVLFVEDAAGRILARLDGHAIVPKEEYERLVAAAPYKLEA